MKILLINPPMENIVATTQPPFVVAEKGSYPPLGLLYLATMIKRNTDHEIKIIDCQLNKTNLQKLKQQIIKFNPDVAGVTLITFMLIDVFRVAGLIKECALALGKKITIVGGGPHASIFPEETIARDEFDYVFAGESEYNFLSFISSFNKPGAFQDIPGIFYKDNGRVKKGPDNTYIKDLDSLPVPDRTLLDYRQYKNLLAGKGLMTTSITTRGCPYGCIYCDRLGKVFRATSAEYAIDEIKQCLDLGIDEIFFHDDTFTLDKQRVMKICGLIQEQGLKFKFSLRSRVDTIDEEMIAELKKCGCKRISFGVESGTEKILKRIKKGITLKQVETAFSLTKKYGIATLADFMIGNPDETEEDIAASLSFAKKLDPDYAQFSITTPYPGTELYRQALNDGVIKTDVWQEFTQNPKKDFLAPRWERSLSREKLDFLLNKCYKQFYLRPKFICKSLVSLKSWPELRRKARAGLGIFKNTLFNA